MNPLHWLISVLAPDVCIGCGAEGQLLCYWCRSSLAHVSSRCYGCDKSSRYSITCSHCRRRRPLGFVLVRTPYDSSVARRLIWRLKFDRSQAAATEMAEMMAPLLRRVPKSTVIVHLPTAPQRVRARGYDQAQLIARRLGRLSGLPYRQLLYRQSGNEQIGANREQRQVQQRNAYVVGRSARVVGRHILLVDDVITTGASLDAAATALLACGARSVSAIVFAAA